MGIIDKQRAERERQKGMLIMVLAKHVGRQNRISMPALYEAVFDDPWDDKINSTRRLRSLITELRGDGYAICSSAASETGGYWLASAGSEITDYTRSLKKIGIKKLAQAAKLENVALPELMGQLSIEFASGKEAC